MLFNKRLCCEKYVFGKFHAWTSQNILTQIKMVKCHRWYNHMGPPSYMWIFVDQNFAMQHIIHIFASFYKTAGIVVSKSWKIFPRQQNLITLYKIKSNVNICTQRTTFLNCLTNTGCNFDFISQPNLISELYVAFKNDNLVECGTSIKKSCWSAIWFY